MDGLSPPAPRPRPCVAFRGEDSMVEVIEEKPVRKPQRQTRVVAFAEASVDSMVEMIEDDEDVYHVRPPSRRKVAFSDASEDSEMEVMDQPGSFGGSVWNFWWNKGATTHCTGEPGLDSSNMSDWPSSWGTGRSRAGTMAKVRTLRKTFVNAVEKVSQEQGANLWQSMQFGIMRRLTAGTSTGAAVMLAVLNAMIFEVRWLHGIFKPEWPRITPCVLLAMAMLVSVFGCKTVGGRLHSEAPLGGRFGLGKIWRYKAIIKPGGRYFHVKAALLKTLQILNMSLRLWEYVFTGQSVSWVYFQGLLVLVNGVFSPYLLLSTKPELHTIGLLIFDVLLDTTYGSIMPISMVTSDAMPIAWTYFRHPVAFEHDFHRRTEPTGQQWQAVNLFKRMVPQNWSQLISVVWPFISATLRLRDTRYAALLFPTGALNVKTQYPYRRSLGALFASFGVAAFIAAAYVMSKPTCGVSVRWHQACLVASPSINRSTCRCMYIKLNRTHIGTTPLNSSLTKPNLRVMLEESGASLQLLVVDDLDDPDFVDFPSLDGNTDLVWFFAHRGVVEHLPDLSQNVNLERLVFKHHRLRDIPDLSNNAKLMWLDVTENQVQEVPDLRGCPRLERLMVSSNNLTTLPCLDENLALRKLRAYDNNLTIEGFPSLHANARLTVLDLTTNSMTNLPNLSNNRRLSELRAADNHLSTLPDMRENILLEELDIAGNRFHDMPDLSGNTHIWFLDASHNQFSNGVASPLNLGHLHNLTVVDLCASKHYTGDFERAHVEEDDPASRHFHVKISRQAPLFRCSNASSSRCSCCSASSFHVGDDEVPDVSTWHLYGLGFACLCWLALLGRLYVVLVGHPQRRSFLTAAWLGFFVFLGLLWWSARPSVALPCP